MSAPTAIHGGTAPLAALTSVFTPPCPTSWLLTTTRLLSQYPAFPTTGPEACDPPAWRTNIARAGFEYYSPAICPNGFVVGPNCGITKTRTAEGFPAIAPGETAVYCVPIGLTCTTDTSDFRGGVWGFARDATTPGAIVTVGPALQIRWVEADLTMLETHPLTPGLRLARTESKTETGTTLVSVTRSTKTTKGPDTQQTSSATSSTTTNSQPDESLTLIFVTESSTSSLGPANTASSQPSNEGGIGSLSRGTSIAVIVVVTVVAGIGLWVIAFLLIRRHKKKARKRMESSPRSIRTVATSGRQGGQHTRGNSAATKSIIASPMSELESGPPALGSTPNPAELEGDIVIHPPSRPWMGQKSWLNRTSLHPPPYSPRSQQSTRSTRRTVRESFGEKVNDPAAALGRLKIPSLLSPGRPSPSSASPRTPKTPRSNAFWRLGRSSPRSPSAAAGPSRLSAQLPKPSPRSGLSENVSRASTPGRGKPGWQDGAGGTKLQQQQQQRHDATP